jgi:TetR/AcrR family transcriptional regulator
MAELPRAGGRSTHDLILDAAERLFVARGFGETALRDVARDAGVTRSLIHHHFSSKEGLWRAVLDRRFAAYVKMQHGVLDRPDLDADDFAESLRSLFAFHARNPDVSRLQAWTNAGAGADYPETRELTERGVAQLRKMQADETLRADLDPAAVMAAFFGLVEHWFQARAGLRGRFGEALPDDATYLETAARILLRGVQP